MPAFTNTTSLLERHLLLQLGDRIKRLRKAQGLSTVEMAKRVGISRTTLAAVEAGDPAPSVGTYLRVMSVLGVAVDLALPVSDTFQPAPVDSAAASSRRAAPQVEVRVRTDLSRHQAQDLQSLALHREAVRLIEADPALLFRAQEGPRAHHPGCGRNNEPERMAPSGGRQSHASRKGFRHLANKGASVRKRFLGAVQPLTASLPGVPTSVTTPPSPDGLHRARGFRCGRRAMRLPTAAVR